MNLSELKAENVRAKSENKREDSLSSLAIPKSS